MTAEQKRRRIERPLTEPERQFSEEHLGIVRWYLQQRKLSEAEWYDVAVLRYLQTVKRWHEEPELRAYSFATIAVWAMRSAVGNELRTAQHRPRTVSLYDTVPGTEHLTYADIL